MAVSYASSTASSVIVVCEYLNSRGSDVDAILREAGINRDKLTQPTERVPWENWSTLLELAIKETDDPNLALRLGDYVHPTSYYPVGISYLSSSSLYDFCQRIVRYSLILSTNYQVDFEEAGDRGCLTCTPVAEVRDSEFGYVSVESLIALVIRYVRYMYRPDYSPEKVEFAATCANNNVAAYEEYFGCPVEFGADRSGIYFSMQDLLTRLPAANADLARQSDAVVMEYLRKMGRIDLIGEVHAKIISLLPSGSCTMEKVAESMHMSARSLHNKLSDTGHRFQELLDDTRRELAEEYIRKNELSVSEIAYMLGFSDCSNFTRAFKRWTGVAPTEFRDSDPAEKQPGENS